MPSETELKHPRITTEPRAWPAADDGRFDVGEAAPARAALHLFSAAGTRSYVVPNLTAEQLYQLIEQAALALAQLEAASRPRRVLT